MTSTPPISTTHEFQGLLLKLKISLVTLLIKGCGAFLCLQHSHRASCSIAQANLYGYTLIVYLKHAYTKGVIIPKLASTLTDIQIRRVKPKDQTYSQPHGQYLLLCVHTSGTKEWILSCERPLTAIFWLSETPINSAYCSHLEVIRFNERLLRNLAMVIIR